MEIALKRLDGVEKVAISLSRQTFEVTYKPGTRFQPGDLRAAVGAAEVLVNRFYIAAQGEVQEENSQRFFVAGKDRFLLLNAANLPLRTSLRIMGRVDDSEEPFKLKVIEFKPVHE